jgi:formylglycine-generating enzyme required for sulfatase activity
MTKIFLLSLLLILPVIAQSSPQYLNSKSERSHYSLEQLPAPKIQQSGGGIILHWNNLGAYLSHYPDQNQDDYGFISPIERADPQKEAEKEVVKLIQQQGVYQQFQQINHEQRDSLDEHALKLLYDRLKPSLSIPSISKSESGIEGFLLTSTPILILNIEWEIPMQLLQKPLEQAIASSEVGKKRRLDEERRGVEQGKRESEEAERKAAVAKRQEEERLVLLAKEERQRKEAERRRVKALEELSEIVIGEKPRGIDSVAIMTQLVESSPQWAARFSLTLTIKTNIEQGSVTIDGVGHGKQRFPYTAKLSIGEHSIAIDRPGYQPQSQKLTMTLGKPEQREEVRINLQRIGIPGHPGGFKMVLLGEQRKQLCYQMGSPHNEKGRIDNERQHRVCIKGFRIASHEVTNAMYRAYRRSYKNLVFAGHSQNSDQQPVVNLNWNEANRYIDWLNSTLSPNKPYRLPTEAEWEYAARGGEESRRYWGADRGEDRACDYANVLTTKTRFFLELDLDLDRDFRNVRTFNCEDNNLVSSLVGSYRSNDYGLYDVLGNVWEWTSSEYDEDYGGGELHASTQDRYSGLRVLRGGSWGDQSELIRVAFRAFKSSDYRNGHVGLRLAQDL